MVIYFVSALLLFSADAMVCGIWHRILSGNSFTGTVPQAYKDFDALIEMNLSNNELTGTLEKDYSDISSLKLLDLSDNELTGGFPREWSRFSGLESL